LQNINHQRDDFRGSLTGIINVSFINLLRFHGVQQFGAHEVSAGHFDVKAGLDGCAVCGTPVRHDEAGELHDALEVTLQCGVVLARPRTIYFVVGAHE
jgi:hypothetical protein